jgi:hypothetical protein
MLNRKIQSATYTGKVEALRGHRCLVREANSELEPVAKGCVKAQFDEPYLSLNGKVLSYGWHDFPAGDFDIDLEFEDEETD